MPTYSTKVTDYGYKETVTVYSKPIAYGEDSIAPPAVRRKYENMDEEAQKKSDERRIRYLKQKKAYLIELALLNKLNIFATFTFRDSNMTSDYSFVVAKWTSFLKRLRYYVDSISYICTLEIQEKRSKNEGFEKGKGIYHFHCLFNMGYIPQKQLEKIWGQGFVFVRYLGDECSRTNVVRYCMKYLVH